QVRVQGRRREGDPRERAQGAARRCEVDPGHQGPDRGRGRGRTATGARCGQTVPDGDRGRVLDQGPRHGGDGAYRGREGERERRGGDPRVHGAEEDGGDGRGDVPEATGSGAGG